MAKIVLGIGTSHAPQLRMAPDQWYRRVQADHRNPELWYRGKTYTFPELVEERTDQHFERQLGDEKAQQRFEACQRAIGHLAATLERVAPDVVVIFGDDQHESFKDDNMPAISVYWGDTVDDAPLLGHEGYQTSELLATPWANAPKERVSHPTDSALGLHTIQSLIESGFDVAHSRSLPAQNHDGAIGHAVHFVYRRLMNNQVIPNVPILLNTYFPPNQPTLPRCYALGSAVRQAIESWENDKRVAVIASGGLSHFVIEEDLDEHIIDALKNKDEHKLTSLPANRFNSGTSEIRNWIAVAGALADDEREMELVDYVPCYRSEAGTGCAMGFAQWV
jgi:hypothetical protein